VERELPIAWVNDQLALPDAEKGALIDLVESALAMAEPGAPPQAVARDLARVIGPRISSASASDRDAQTTQIEGFLVEYLISWTWQRRGIERRIAGRLPGLRRSFAFDGCCLLGWSVPTLRGGAVRHRRCSRSLAVRSRYRHGED